MLLYCPLDCTYFKIYFIVAIKFCTRIYNNASASGQLINARLIRVSLLFSKQKTRLHSPHPAPRRRATTLETSSWWKILVLICLYCLKCTRFGKLFLRKVIKIVATRCLDFSSKCTKMRLAAGLCPAPRPPSWI